MKRLILLVVFQVFAVALLAQDYKTGLPGMAPTKWITFRNTHAPGRVYGVPGNSRRYTLEESYIKAWIPVMRKSRFVMAIAPYYRSEQFEIKGTEAFDGEQMSTWNLRAVGLDMKSLICIDSGTWMINTANISKSANVAGGSLSSVPFTYTLSSVFMKRRSPDTEMGLGIMVNRSNNFLILPVVVYNHNFSSRFGIEMTLPHKLAWRYNMSPANLLYVKAEANTRSYFLPQLTGDTQDAFRRIDVDMGVAYNKSFTSFFGAEIFAGYRKNLSTRLPGSMLAVKSSGCFMTFELYLRPPQGFRLHKRK